MNCYQFNKPLYIVRNQVLCINNMDDLPLELVAKILGYLQLQDKLKCRMVSRQFQQIIDSNNKELAIANELIVPRWFDDAKYINCRNKIKLRNDVERFETSSYFRNRFFVGVRKLYLNLTPDLNNSEKQFQIKTLDFMNNFVQLQTLSITCIAFSNYHLQGDGHKAVTTLRLLNLENLDIFLAGRNFHLIFDTPNLRYLSTLSQFDLMEFVHPGSLRRVRTGLRTENVPIIKRFTNLETLEFGGEKNHIRCLIELIDELKMLGELHLNIFDTDLDELKRYSMDHSSKLKIYCHGILLDHWPELPAHYRSGTFDGRLDGDNLRVYLKHYPSSVAAKLELFNHLNYNAWECEWLSNKRLLNDFRKRLVQLSGIKVSGRVVDYANFIQFLCSAQSTISRLDLVDSNFGQEFYSSLNVLLPSLSDLYIHDRPDIVANLDLGFLLEKQHLFNFAINHRLDLAFVGRLFLAVKVYQVEFVFGGRRIAIKRLGYKLSTYREPDDEVLRSFIANLIDEYTNKYADFVLFEVLPVNDTGS